MSLKDLTHEAHRQAETRPFVKILFSGKVDPKLYATYLKNQHPIYEVLEVCAMPLQLLHGLTDIRRAPSILEDFIEIWGKDNPEKPKMCPTVDRYIRYILSIKDDPRKLMAHIYVRHMGDLAGGQMIAKRVPGTGKYYQFTDPEGLKSAIRGKIDDELAEEAKVCFKFAADLFEDMLVIAKDYE
jgi:heme oxygenase